ncbi:organoarsenical effux MFS transporter ArsJ [Kineobactrum salinum]|uniref:organoarsenical effux MFS transporter ArsJ n=1 Tax=Kineobactrum salinum TaxID=2708301 RepID=UPI002F960FB1
MNIGLLLQVVALAMLLVPTAMLTVPWVMAAQALSGIAKDLNKMSAKSAIKLLVPETAQGTLYKWVALLTGSKNALKGLGFFLGGVLLMTLGFTAAVGSMAAVLALVWISSMLLLSKDLGKAKNKPKFREIFSKSRAINVLSAARLCLFAARDVWFVVALPVFLSRTLGWDHWQTGGFLALWVMAYGLVQACAPVVTGRVGGRVPDGRTAMRWAVPLVLLPALMALGLLQGLPPGPTLFVGLLLFGVLFAINSSIHSYLILSYAGADGVSLDVGFYYMANAMGRLLGTVLSGWIFQLAGLEACLLISTLLLLAAAATARWLPEGSTL